jgi:integrase
MLDPNYYKLHLQTDLKRLSLSTKILDENKKLILDFLEFMKANGISEPTQRLYIWSLSMSAIQLNKPFTQVTKEDVIRLVGYIEGNYKSEKSRITLKSDLKIFYRWLRGKEDYPEEVAWIKVRPKERNSKLPEEILTEEEIVRMSNKALSHRDKALSLILFESGCRVGELMALKIKNVQFDDFGCVLIVPKGKTGARRVRIIKYAKELLAWLDVHPEKNNPEAYVWVSLGRNKNELLSYMEIREILRRLGKRAGMTKKVNPHSFRHARATQLAGMNVGDAIMKEIFGWEKDSRMASVYYHLSGKNVDEVLLRINGIKTNELETKPITSRTCVRCGHVNSVLSHFCKNCNTPLDLKVMLELDSNRKEFDNFVKDFLLVLAERDKNVKEIFKQMVKERHLEYLFEDSS